MLAPDARNRLPAMALEHLAYLSTAAPGITEEDIRLILEKSRRNNPTARVTGHLQCHGGFFFQVLEGPGDALDNLLAKLLADTRHADLRVLYREPLDRRHFANWSMGYGPCHSGTDDTAHRRRLLDLRDSPSPSAQRVLGVFFSLLEEQAGGR